MEPSANGDRQQPYEAAPPPPYAPEQGGFTPPGTVSGQIKFLMRDARVLVRQEMELARAEMNEKLSNVKRGAGYMGAAGALLFAGLLGLCAAVMWFLAIWIPLWLSSLIVSAALLVIGGLLFSSGKKNVEPDQLTPDRTMDSLKRDQRLVKEHLR